MLTIVVLVLVPWSAQARTINVPGDVATVQGAINAAVNGDTVLVAPGTYAGGLSISGKTITLASQFLTTGDESYVGRTIISGGSPVINVSSTGPDTKIVGFTITGSGKGIVLFSHIQVLNNRFLNTGSDALSFEEIGGVARNNTFDNAGDDGIDVDGNTTDLVVENNIIRNSGDDGIEIRLYPYTGPTRTIVIRNNIISGNDEDGIQLIDYPGLSSKIIRIERNLIQSNRMVGVGMMADANTVEDFSGAPIPEPIFLMNNTFVGNDHALTGGANVTARNNIFFGATRLGLKNVGGSSTVAHSLFWQNGTNSQASNVDQSTSIFADPAFDATYHLLAGSPAIDAGVEVGSPYNGAAPDLGAYETGGTTVPGPLVADAGPDRSGSEGESVTFTGSASGGTAPYSFAWEFGDGGTGSGASVTHTYTTAGTYPVTLTVTDAAGTRAQDTASVPIAPLGSPPPPEPGPAPGQTLAFTPVADATIVQLEPTSNLGGATSLMVEGDPVRHVLMKFNVSGLAGQRVVRAALRLYAVNASDRGGDFWRVANQTWSESTVTWSNAPAADATVLASLGAVSAGQWYEVDLTPLITDEDGTYSVRVTSPSADTAGFNSREAASNRPQLVVTTESAAGAPLVADAGLDRSGDEGASVTFTGSAAGGTAPYSFAWQFSDGATAPGATVTHVYADNGSFVAILTVTDATGASTTDTAAVTISNVAPTANAGGPYTATSPITFGGAGTDPSPADTAAGLQFSWDLGDGTTATGSAPTHTYAAPGTYTVRLTVTDKDGGSGSATTTANVGSDTPPDPAPSPAPGQTLTFTPVADATIVQLEPTTNRGGTTSLMVEGDPVRHVLMKFNVSGLAGQRVVRAVLRLYAVNASDRGGDVRRVEDQTWAESTVTWSNAPAADAAVLASLGAVSLGQWYEVDLTPLITDGDGTYSVRVTSPSADTAGFNSREAASNRPQLVVTTESAAGAPLVADAGLDRTGDEGASVTFTGSASGGTAPYTFAWQFGDGATAPGATATHVYADNGSFVATLTVTDATGASTTDTAAVTISNVAPTANAGGPYTATSPITFGGAGTDPSPADTAAGLQFAWDLGDGTTATGSAPTHTYAAPGTYTVRLTVTDKDGGSGSATTTANVGGGDTPPDPVPAPGQTLTFTPVADATIAQLEPTSNLGGATSLMVEGDPVRHALMKFNVSGLAGQRVVRAALRLYAVNASDRGGDFWRVADQTWSESTVTWSNAPAADATVLASLGAVSVGQWYEVDLTPLIAAGDGTYSVRVTSPSADSAGFNSREAASNRPQLVVTTEGSSSGAPLVADAGADVASTAGTALTFGGSATGGTAPYTSRWQFGDGGTATGATATHSYTTGGTFTVTFDVTDAGGQTAQDTATAIISGSTPTPPPPTPDFLPAFPGAEGFGAKAVGGRGGRVIEVTNLNDSGPGSLRAAIAASGPRIVVFRMGGTIELMTPLIISNPFITIAGQTAPGDGIALKSHLSNPNGPLAIDASHVIVRYLRVRQGPGGDGDAVTIRAGSNIIVDHCSFAWAVDEVVNTWYSPSNITFQWSIMAESLHNSTHYEGPHSMGLFLGSDLSHSISAHHNLVAHTNKRNPAIKTHGTVDMVNNVFYNWGEDAGVVDDKFGKIPINFVGNYYKPGPSSDPNYELDVYERGTHGFSLFVQGNIGPNRPADTGPEAAVVSPNGHKYLVSTRNPAPLVTTTSAPEAYNHVLANAGAHFPIRDSVDQRIVNDVRNGTGRIIDHPDEVGGWPVLAPGTPPVDTDHDGMPDAWELARGLDPQRDDSSGDRDGDGYTNIEEYLNELVSQ